MASEALQQFASRLQSTCGAGDSPDRALFDSILERLKSTRSPVTSGFRTSYSSPKRSSAMGYLPVYMNCAKGRPTQGRYRTSLRLLYVRLLGSDFSRGLVAILTLSFRE